MLINDALQVLVQVANCVFNVFLCVVYELIEIDDVFFDRIVQKFVELLLIFGQIVFFESEIKIIVVWKKFFGCSKGRKIA